MGKLLIINASARKERSLSRHLTEVFVKNWKEKYPDDRITYRDVGQDNIPHVTEKWIAAAFTPAELRGAEDKETLKLSNQLVAELKDADVIVLGTPMYNWSVPSALKAYIDQVLRVNETVLVDKNNPENPYKGLLDDKKVYLLMVRGNAGYDPGEFYEHMDFQTNYLKTVFSIMGVEHIEHVSLNGVDFGEKKLEVAGEQIKNLICQEEIVA
ncbi:NAD(P)H dehydrogenase [Chryseobacterium sp. T16E-39]|uniref:FMN-dependent NADH-azoreductase n=1 Tax=Chryseobacterium sp. T16E-39 TaxID=2015076 RepID=UPI000B5B44EA|nr:NAD(P)H-dependent oxidoreductase [Chryseobacterium sp. T16E-39]ASK28851.1 NAD(P)H dehydrogenase [Chryseobacterium sp. T16E-39]